ncbi:MAG: SBBP repeat-containing protein, partial [Acidobacteria bacterium]|nr:SBBP repeat-containing protein [Acidobacteriota bacterium]
MPPQTVAAMRPMSKPQPAPPARHANTIPKKAEDAMKSRRTIVILSLSLTLGLSCLLNLPVPPAMNIGSDATPPVADTGQTHAGSPPSNASAETSLTLSKAHEAYGKLELQFEANQGQTDPSVNFLARGAGYTMFLKPAEAVFVLMRQGRNDSTTQRTQKQIDDDVRLTPSAGKTPAPAAPHATTAVLRMKLVGADASAAAEGADELAGKVNYFKGNNPEQWHAGVRTYGRVRYSEVYPGIDVVYYGNQKQLEYDFVIAPGHDARAVSLQFEGVDKMEVDGRGDLLLTLGDDVIRQPKPFVYQEVAGARRTIEGGYAVGTDGRVGFTVGEYDTGRPLIIDPVLVYSTYLGGSSSDLARAIAVDSAGNAYTTGYTTSTNFPTANAFQASLDGTADAFGDRDAFVTKINAAGTAFVYSTYLGGNGGDEARGIAVDSSGNAYVAGFTASTDFPVANAIQATLGTTNEDAFVTKLNAAGSALVYSTYLGGNESAEFGEAIAVDSSGNAYVTGSTFSDDFPTVNPIQATFGGGSTDAFVTKINAAGSAIIYSTYLGGNGDAAITGIGSETGRGIAADASGNTYVTGEINSTNYPTANAIQATFGGGGTDAFVAKINATGSAFVYSTYLGGGDQDSGEGIKADASGNTYVAGFTISTNFPTANALQGTNGGSQDAFVAKLNPAGSAFVYSTYFGGLGGEIAFGIAVDASNNVYLGGSTGSTSTFPVANAIQCARNGGQDIFVTKLNAAATAIIYSTYLGGSGADDGQGIALDSSNNAYIAGTTTSTDFPTANPIQAANSGGTPFGDAFVAKLNDALSPNACATPTPTPTPTPTATPTPTPTATPTPTPTPRVVQFAQSAQTVSEGATSITITVSRSGDTAAASNVDYATAADAAFTG